MNSHEIQGSILRGSERKDFLENSGKQIIKIIYANSSISHDP
jgi:hypothetical protein